ncbi:uncharacterized protein LOC134764605 [Penaeus indicus]|uniref:uncharacterized protein LOC134764605 n=1 Tax=Penaeus indicus TaxID=29960 RepID=UPI00300D8350
MRPKKSEASGQKRDWWRWWRLAALSAMICCPLAKASVVDEETETVNAPLPSLYMRQETVLQKLDTLIDKVNKVDVLEAKIVELTALVSERNSLAEDLGDRPSGESNPGQAEALSAMGAKLDLLSDDMRTLSATFSAVAASVAQLDQRLGGILCASDGREELLEAQAVNFTLTVDGALEQMKNQLRETVENASISLASPSSPLECEALTEIQESLARLEDVERPSTNTTKQLFASVLNRIRVSNVAMDKRLGAVLHTSSLRQRVLQDTLLAALASVMTLVRSETRDVLTGMDDRLQELQNTITTAAMKQEEDVAILVQETINTTLTEALSAAKGDIEVLVQAHENLTTAVAPLLALRNLTEMNIRENVNQLCVVPIADGSENVTSYSVHPQSTQDTGMIELKQDLDHQLREIRDQLDGLRIYYGTSLHMHTNEVLNEVETAQDQVNEAVRVTLEKSLRHLEKLRRSSLGFLDAAVTSVSSSAVASAQSTADQLKKELKKVAKSLEERMMQVEAAVSSRGSGCPHRYTYVGGRCLLAMPLASATWETARALCLDADGGDLALLPDTASLVAATPFLFPAPTTPASYWVGGKSQAAAEDWTWVDGSPVRVEMSVLLPLEEGPVDGGEECLALVEGRDEALLVATSCMGSRGALCQYPPPMIYASRTPATPAPMADDTSPPVIAFHDNAFDLEDHDFRVSDVIF